MKKSIISIISLLLCSQLNAQILTGNVYDEVTKKPISEVLVYLDGTSIYTLTDTTGKFELKVNQIINAQLILSHVAYKTITVANPFQKMPDSFYMTEQITTMQEVQISADRFTRAQKLQAFREQFLGRNNAGKSCKILNEEDIHFSYDLDSQTLTASADKPLEIINDFLGYKIVCNLVDFKIQFADWHRLENEYVNQTYYAVNTSFMDLKPNDRKIKRRRDEVYLHSPNYFFKNFSNNTLKQSRHTISNGGFQINPANYFTITDTLSMTLIQIKPNAHLSTNTINRTNTGTGFNTPLFGIIDVLNENGNKKERSTIYLYTSEFLVDQYGNVDKFDKLFFAGYMGNFRVGDMLPLEYMEYKP